MAALTAAARIVAVTTRAATSRYKRARAGSLFRHASVAAMGAGTEAPLPPPRRTPRTGSVGAMLPAQPGSGAGAGGDDSEADARDWRASDEPAAEAGGLPSARSAASAAERERHVCLIADNVRACSDAARVRSRMFGRT